MANKAILIVDDQGYLRQLIRTSLGSQGFTNLMEASDGMNASRMLEKNKVDLVICDWEMPNMDGMELFADLQKKTGLKDTPFILLTKHGDKGKVTRAIGAGIKNYIVKPFTPEIIIGKVMDILQ